MLFQYQPTFGSKHLSNWFSKRKFCGTIFIKFSQNHTKTSRKTNRDQFTIMTDAPISSSHTSNKRNIKHQSIKQGKSIINYEPTAILHQIPTIHSLSTTLRPQNMWKMVANMRYTLNINTQSLVHSHRRSEKQTCLETTGPCLRFCVQAVSSPTQITSNVKLWF